MTNTAASARLTDHELAALVEMQPTPQGRRTLEAAGLADLLAEASVVRAGYSTLLVRGLATIEEDAIVAQGLAASVGTMLTTADDVLLLELTRGDAVFGRTLLVDAAVGGFLLDMTAYGVHAAQPLHLDTDLLALVRDIVAELAADAGQPLTATLTRFPVVGEPRTASLHVTGPDAPSPDAWAAVSRTLGRSDAVAAANMRRAAD